MLQNKKNIYKNNTIFTAVRKLILIEALYQHILVERIFYIPL
jgi:hypothetical protein